MDEQSHSGTSFGPILDRYNRKNNSDCKQSVILKKRRFFMLFKEQNNSHQSSLSTGPNDFLNSSKLIYPFSLFEWLWSFLLFFNLLNL